MKREMLEKMDLVGLNKELKRLASLKCNLKKRKGLSDEEKKRKLVEILKAEDTVKEVKNGKMNKGKGYFEYEEKDIERLEIDELIRFRKGISSKKCLDGGDEEIFNKCEELLKYSKEILDKKRAEENKNVVSKDNVRKLVENFEMGGSKEELLDVLKSLIE